MNVVSNASPLIALIRIGQLDLLRQLYGTIVLPEAVWHEVVVEGADQPGAEVASSASWIVRRTVTNRPLVHGLQQELDAGEAEAIALAVEIDDALLLAIDAAALKKKMTSVELIIEAIEVYISAVNRRA